MYKNLLQQLALFCPVFLGIGILLGVYFPCTNRTILYTILSISIVSLYKYWIISIITFGIYIAQTGGIFNYSASELLTERQFLSKTYDKISFTADIDFIDETHPVMKNMQRVKLKNIHFPKNSELSFLHTAKMTCSSKIIKDFNPNDHVKIFGQLTPLKDAIIPLSFDQKQFYALNHLDTTGIVFNLKETKTKTQEIKSQKTKPQKAKPQEISPQRNKSRRDESSNKFATIRRKLTKNIMLKLGPETGGIASALVTGDKSPIKTEIRDYFIKSGTAHILAISGLHMTIVSSIIYIFFFRLLLYLSGIILCINPQRIAAIITIIITYLYLAISDFSPSATRAFIMTTIVLIAIMLGRSIFSMRNVSVAAFLILIYDPAALFSVSFQLSFSAVVALIAFYQRYKNIIMRINNKYDNFLYKIVIYFANSCITTFLASIATAPISIATFNRFSFCSIIGNLVAIPLTVFGIMPLGILCLVGGYHSEILMTLLNKLISLLIYLLSKVSNLPYSDVSIRSPNISTLYIVMFGGILLCLLQNKLKHIGSVLITFGILLWIYEPRPILVKFADTICFVKDNKFYANSKRRRAIYSIQRNLGFSGEIIKFNQIDNINNKLFSSKLFNNKLFNSKKPIYIFSNNKVYSFYKSKHPYCPGFYRHIMF